MVSLQTHVGSTGVFAGSFHVVVRVLVTLKVDMCSSKATEKRSSAQSYPHCEHVQTHLYQCTISITQQSHTRVDCREVCRLFTPYCAIRCQRIKASQEWTFWEYFFKRISTIRQHCSPEFAAGRLSAVLCADLLYKMLKTQHNLEPCCLSFHGTHAGVFQRAEKNYLQEQSLSYCHHLVWPKLTECCVCCPCLRIMLLVEAYKRNSGSWVKN